MDVGANLMKIWLHLCSLWAPFCSKKLQNCTRISLKIHWKVGTWSALLWISLAWFSHVFFMNLISLLGQTAISRMRDTILTCSFSKYSLSWFTLESFWSRVFILSRILRPKTPKIMHNHIYTKLEWFFDPFRMNVHTFWIDCVADLVVTRRLV